MMFRNNKHNCTRLEHCQIAFFISRNLPERMQGKMWGFLHLRERNTTNVTWLTHFLPRPANALVTGQPLPRSGDCANAMRVGAVGRVMMQLPFGSHFVLAAICVRFEQQLQIPVQMINAFGCNLGPTLCLGEDEGTLQNGLCVQRQ